MSEMFNIKVPIRNELRKSLIFGLQARLQIGVILSFTGYHNEVLPLMQRLSPGTRAYLENADGLRGFII